MDQAGQHVLKSDAANTQRGRPPSGDPPAQPFSLTTPPSAAPCGDISGRGPQGRIRNPRSWSARRVPHRAVPR